MSFILFFMINFGFLIAKDSLFSESPYVQDLESVVSLENTLLTSPFNSGMLLIYSNLCGYCQRFAPTFIKLAETFHDKMFFISMSVKTGIKQKLFYSSVPTFYFYYNGTYMKHSVSRKFEKLSKLITDLYLPGCKPIAYQEIQQKYDELYIINEARRNFVI